MGPEDLVRVASYLSVLGVMATWEVLAPRRRLTASKLCRWGGNLTIVILEKKKVPGTIDRPVLAKTKGTF